MRATFLAVALAVAACGGAPAATPIIIYVTPPPTERPSPTPTIIYVTPVPGASPTPTPPQLTYAADWSNGMNGWAGSDDWKWLDGLLLSDGENSRSLILAPYLPPLADYAVEVEVQFLDAESFSNDLFAVVARYQDGTGYWAGIAGQYGLHLFSDRRGAVHHYRHVQPVLTG